jgi:hypothetical protein
MIEGRSSRGGHRDAEYCDSLDGLHGVLPVSGDEVIPPQDFPQPALEPPSFRDKCRFVQVAAGGRLPTCFQLSTSDDEFLVLDLTVPVEEDDYVGVGHPLDESGDADCAFTPVGHNFVPKQSKGRLRFAAVWEQIHSTLEAHRTEPLDPPTEFDSEIVRFGWEGCDEHEPFRLKLA